MSQDRHRLSLLQQRKRQLQRLESHSAGGRCGPRGYRVRCGCVPPHKSPIEGFTIFRSNSWRTLSCIKLFEVRKAARRGMDFRSVWRSIFLVISADRNSCSALSQDSAATHVNIFSALNPSRSSSRCEVQFEMLSPEMKTEDAPDSCQRDVCLWYRTVAFYVTPAAGMTT